MAEIPSDLIRHDLFKAWSDCTFGVSSPIPISVSDKVSSTGTGCISQKHANFQIKMLKEPLLVHKQTIPHMKGLILTFLKLE